MWTDELDLSTREERAAESLRRALQDASDEWPVRVDPAAWVARGGERRPIARWLPVGLAAALVVVLLGVVGFAASPLLVGGPKTSPTPNPGHYDGESFSFDYPTSWWTQTGSYPEGFVNEVFIVLGTGTWKSGCWYASDSSGGGQGACTGDTFDVSGGRVVVKVWERNGGPVDMCGDNTAPPNATLGPNAVEQSVGNQAVLWEIRQPGTEFGWVNNVFVEVHTANPVELANARALVASFRWSPDAVSGGCFQQETESPSPS